MSFFRSLSAALRGRPDENEQLVEALQRCKNLGCEDRIRELERDIALLEQENLALESLDDLMVPLSATVPSEGSTPDEGALAVSGMLCEPAALHGTSTGLAPKPQVQWPRVQPQVCEAAPSHFSQACAPRNLEHSFHVSRERLADKELPGRHPLRFQRPPAVNPTRRIVPDSPRQQEVPVSQGRMPTTPRTQRVVQPRAVNTSDLDLLEQLTIDLSNALKVTT